MWNDIRTRSAELEKNNVVSSLINGKMGWQSKTAVLTPRQLDETLSPSDMAGALWQGERTDFERLEKAFGSTAAIMQKRSFSLYSPAVSRLTVDSNAAETVRSNAAVLCGFLADLGKAEQKYALDLSAQKSSADFFEALREAACRWSGSISALRERAALENALCSPEKLGLKCTADSARGGKVSGDDFIPAFEYSFDLSRISLTTCCLSCLSTDKKHFIRNPLLQTYILCCNLCQDRYRMKNRQGYTRRTTPCPLSYRFRPSLRLRQRPLPRSL